MEMIPVQSSNLSAIGYDHDTEILHVAFSDGSIYEYRNVPQAVFNELASASSHGSYLNREIVGRYPYEKIG